MDRRHATALVTGAGGHIGGPIVRALADRGFRVAVNDIDESSAASLTESVPDSIAVVADVSEPDAATDAVHEAAARLGTIGVLVNAAGIEGPIAPIEECDPAEVRRTFDTNVLSMFWSSRAIAPLMKAAGGGRIVNMASGAGLAGGALATAYHASKHAVVGLTRSLARELGPHEIAVNAVCPGYVESPMVDRILGAEQSATGRSVDVSGSVPMGRMATADEVASTVAYLAADSPVYMTGTCLVMDGALRA